MVKYIHVHRIYYEPRVAVVLKHCQGCMRVHVCVGFVIGRLQAYFLHIMTMILFASST